MRKLMIIAIAVLSTSFAQAQVKEKQTFSNWKVNGYNSGDAYMWTVGSPVSNSTKKPDLTIRWEEGDTFSIRVDGETLFSYTEGKTHVNLSIIFDGDKSTQIDYDGRIVEVNESTSTRVYFKTTGPDTEMVLNGLAKYNSIYIRLIGSGDPMVFKFSALGFSKAMEYSRNFVKKNTIKDPFSLNNNNDDPFKG